MNEGPQLNDYAAYQDYDISKHPNYFFTFPHFSHTYFFIHSLFYLFVLATFSDLICQLIAYFDRITDCIVERSTWLTKMRIAE